MRLHQGLEARLLSARDGLQDDFAQVHARVLGWRQRCPVIPALPGGLQCRGQPRDETANLRENGSALAVQQVHQIEAAEARRLPSIASSQISEVAMQAPDQQHGQRALPCDGRHVAAHIAPARAIDHS